MRALRLAIAKITMSFGSRCSRKRMGSEMSCLYIFYNCTSRSLTYFYISVDANIVEFGFLV